MIDRVRPSGLPLLPTLIVGLAALAMVGLGIWQLHRARWKDGLIARYQAAERLPPIAWPAVPPPDDRLLFRRASGYCLDVVGWDVAAGRDRQGRSGWRHIARCRTGAEGPGMRVDAGWSERWDDKSNWRGGPVTGVITAAPDPHGALQLWAGTRRAPTPMLVAERAAPPFVPSAPPDPDDLPQNHRAYAVQWFVFAALALVIYALALGKRRRLK